MNVAGHEIRIRFVLRQSLQLLLAALLGVVMAHVLFIGYLCVRNRLDGGTLDPRCAAGNVTGYVEWHLRNPPEPERVSCVYRPDVGRGVP